MKYTLQFRIWHWFNAFVILGLLGTVFLRKTFLSWRANSEILMDKLSEFGIIITQEQAKILAKSIREGMWEWHIYLGFALSALIIYRIYLHYKDTSQKEKLSELDLHKKSVKVLYYVLYTTLLFMALSGFTIYFYEFLGLSKEIAHDIKEVHELVYNFILFFVFIHLLGVIIAENRGQEGLISTMINGKEIQS